MESTSRNQQHDSLSDLLARCAATPTSAAAEWMRLERRLTPKLRSAVAGALRRCGGARPSEALDDLVQEAWCRLLAAERLALRRYRGGSDHAAAAYLRRIAATVVFDRVRSDRAEKRQLHQQATLETAHLASARHADPSGCPERRLLARERLRSFGAACVESVAGPQRAVRLCVARMALVEGLASRDIAERVGAPWTIGRVNSFVFRLRRRLEARGLELRARARGTAARASPVRRERR